ncbi:MAG: hypothetical protein AAGE05_05370 [Pseudomonadota bacterium]
MQKYLALPIAVAALVPSVAMAECLPVFADGPAAVTLSPSASFDTQQLVERFFVRIRNEGDTACELRLSVGRDLSTSDADFPIYSLSGPDGNIPIVQMESAVNNADTSTRVNVPASGQVSVPYEVRMAVGWGEEAGAYTQELVYFLVSSDNRSEIQDQRTELNLTIPTAARIRFAGASSGGGPAQVELGTLSPDAVTTAPPFAIRVLSTAAYQMAFVSQNAGQLRRINGPERIPYRMTVSGRLLNMTGGGDQISVGTHTSSTGDVHPVVIIVQPDATRHAGDYTDRVTVTVTPI